MKKLYLLLLKICPLLLNAQATEDDATKYSCLKPRPGIYRPYSTSPGTLPKPKTNIELVHRCPGASISKYITGEPLIVVDNYPFEGSMMDLNLNPSQIKSITVIKDAAA